MANKITVLHENSRGIQIIREDMVKRSAVKVKSGVHTLKTYRMNNVPFYEHPCLSWANLDCCGGWTYDEEYLKSAVQKHKKLVAGITVRIDMEKPDKKTEDQAREMVMAEAESLAFDPDETEWEVVFQHMNGPIACLDDFCCQKWLSFRLLQSG